MPCHWVPDGSYSWELRSCWTGLRTTAGVESKKVGMEYRLVGIEHRTVGMGCRKELVGSRRGQMGSRQAGHRTTKLLAPRQRRLPC